MKDMGGLATIEAGKQAEHVRREKRTENYGRQGPVCRFGGQALIFDDMAGGEEK